jgi:hypothetical protein
LFARGELHRSTRELIITFMIFGRTSLKTENVLKMVDDPFSFLIYFVDSLTCSHNSRACFSCLLPFFACLLACPFTCSLVSVARTPRLQRRLAFLACIIICSLPSLTFIACVVACILWLRPSLASPACISRLYPACIPCVHTFLASLECTPFTTYLCLHLPLTSLHPCMHTSFAPIACIPRLLPLFEFISHITRSRTALQPSLAVCVHPSLVPLLCSQSSFPIFDRIARIAPVLFLLAFSPASLSATQANRMPPHLPTSTALL